MDEEKALSNLLCDLGARDGAAEAETVFRCQMWQKAAAVLPGVNFNLCGKARQGPGRAEPRPMAAQLPASAPGPGCRSTEWRLACLQQGAEVRKGYRAPDREWKSGARRTPTWPGRW